MGVSFVEVDCLPGDHQMLALILSTFNPAIDIGQIEGAIMQGYGLFTLEEFIRRKFFYIQRVQACTNFQAKVIFQES